METAMIVFISFITGVFLGTIYFGGLWITVQRFLTDENHSHLLIIFSFLLRTAIVVLGFYFLLRIMHQWQSMAIALMGFVIVRMIITRTVTQKAKPV